jgi:hypothetical protein
MASQDRNSRLKLPVAGLGCNLVVEYMILAENKDLNTCLTAEYSGVHF